MRANASREGGTKGTERPKLEAGLCSLCGLGKLFNSSLQFASLVNFLNSISFLVNYLGFFRWVIIFSTTTDVFTSSFLVFIVDILFFVSLPWLDVAAVCGMETVVVDRPVSYSWS